MMDAGQALFDNWVGAMRAGDFVSAWRISDRVLDERRGRSSDELPLHQRWLWDGQSLANKRVLVCCYHGLGDTLQFIRYLPLVRRAARRVTLEIQPELMALARTLEGVESLRRLGECGSGADYDCAVEVMELPHVFRSTLATLPAIVPYLHVEPAPVGRAGSDWNVGVVWSAGLGWDNRRSIPVEQISALATVPKVRFFILQQGATLAPAQFGIMSQRGTIFELAQLVRGLDLIITVDSMPAHLAGALAAPVWTLLHADADWRWMAERDDSPWYPTMRLFRQTRAGDWRGVVDRVAAELRRLTRLPRVACGAASTGCHTAVTRVGRGDAGRLRKRSL